VEFSLEVELFHSFQLLLQLRENIAQDQEKSDASKSQMEQLKEKIRGIESEILQMETRLDELRRLQGQINTKATERSTLFTLQQQQYAALSEENEGKVQPLVFPCSQ
jgi:DNA repair protein RAD50